MKIVIFCNFFIDLIDFYCWIDRDPHTEAHEIFGSSDVKCVTLLAENTDEENVAV